MMPTNQKKTASSRLLTNASRNEPTHEEIARCAYSLWEQHGRPQHQEVDFWLQAEAQVREAHNQHVVGA